MIVVCGDRGDGAWWWQYINLFSGHNSSDCPPFPPLALIYLDKVEDLDWTIVTGVEARMIAFRSGGIDIDGATAAWGSAAHRSGARPCALSEAVSVDQPPLAIATRWTAASARTVDVGEASSDAQALLSMRGNVVGGGWGAVALLPTSLGGRIRPCRPMKYVRVGVKHAANIDRGGRSDALRVRPGPIGRYPIG